MNILALISTVTIILVPLGTVVPTTFNECWDIGWAYHVQSNTVYLCEWVGNEEFYKYHELGHAFYYTKLTQAQKDKYHVEYERALKDWAFYRDYGRNSEIEDFADNVSLYILKKNQKPKIQRRINLIKKYFINA